MKVPPETYTQISNILAKCSECGAVFTESQCCHAAFIAMKLKMPEVSSNQGFNDVRCDVCNHAPESHFVCGVQCDLCPVERRCIRYVPKPE